MFKNHLKIFFLIPLIYVFTSAWTFEFIDKPGNQHVVDGLKARDAGQYDAAVQSFRAAIAESVDYQTKSSSMMQIAKIYLAEEPITAAKAQAALRLFKEAEALGSDRAKLAIGDMYRNGQGVAVNNRIAHDYYTQVKDRFPEALISLAEISASPMQARSYIEQATAKLENSINPSVESMILLARHFRDGMIVSRNVSLAEYWFSKATQQDSAPAMMELANLWIETGHQPRSDVTNLWKAAAAQDNHRAALELGFAYATGEGVQRDGQTSSRYFQQAVSLDPGNAYRIGRWYEERVHLDPVYGEVAFNWFRVAAVKGHPDALMRQARAYWGGERVPQDRARAEQLYTIAAQYGSDKALPELAERKQREVMREQKRIAKLEAQAKKRAMQAARKQRDDRKRGGGFDFWMPLAKKGDAEAMLRVGEAYMQGNGVGADTAIGLDWIRKSTNKGNGEAMYVLAQAYSAGLGVDMDLEQAFKWYQKSANAGHVASQYQLGLSYARGIGVAENGQKAREWLDKASKNGYSRAGAILQTLTGVDG